jgi:hypothetical protein
MTEVLIIGDRDLVRIGLRTPLENEDGFAVAGEAALRPWTPRSVPVRMSGCRPRTRPARRLRLPIRLA